MRAALERKSGRRIHRLGPAVLAGALMFVWGTSVAARTQEEEGGKISPTTIATGSGTLYTTTVERTKEGELSAEDFRQASLLASRIVMHLNRAVVQLNEQRAEEAREELAKGVALVGVVRDLLPTTVVTTLVRNSGGEEVYRHVDRVQDDRLPLHEGLVAVKVVEPIVEAKQEAASLEGIRLADADLLHTSVLVELDYVERKLDRALDLLDDKPEEALAQLVLAQSHGVTFSVNREDNPLVEAQLALQLAERMVNQDRHKAAKANLQLAKNHLALYRDLIAEDEESEHVGELEEAITKLQSNITKNEAVAEIREFWDRVAGWFVRKPGEARSTVSEAEAAPR